jgi:hypothetical protein
MIENGAGSSSVARMQQAIAHMQAENLRKAVDECAERQIQLNAGLFDKAAAYTKIIAVVGYAGFFGVWQLTKEYLTREAILASALAIGISIFALRCIRDRKDDLDSTCAARMAAHVTTERSERY